MAEKIEYILSVDDTSGTMTIKKFGDAVDDATKKTKGLGDALSVLKASGIVYLAEQAMNAAEKIYNLAKSVADFGHEIEENAKILGMSTTQYQQWTYAAQVSGSSADSMMNSLKFLSRAIGEAQSGTGRGAEALRAMGVSVTDATGKTKSLDTVMTEIISKMDQWQDGPNKMALGMALFGRGFLDIMPTLNKGIEGITNLKDQSLATGGVLGEDLVAELAKSKESFEKLSIVWKTFVAEVIAPLIPLLTSVLELIVKIVSGLGSIESNKKAYQALSPMEEQMYEAVGAGTSTAAAVTTGVTNQVAKVTKPQAPAMISSASIVARLKAQMEAQLSVIREGIDKQHNLLEIAITQNESDLTQRLQNETDYINRKFDLQATDIMNTQSGLEKQYTIEASFYDKMIKESSSDLTKRADLEKQKTEALSRLRQQMDDASSKFAENEIKRNDALYQSNQKLQEVFGSLIHQYEAPPAEAYAPRTMPDVIARQQKDVLDLQAEYARITNDLNAQVDIQIKLLELQRDQLDPLSQEYELLEKIISKRKEQLEQPWTGVAGGLDQYVAEQGTLYDQLLKETKDLASGMESAFSNFFQSIFDKGLSWSQRMQRLFQDFANAFIQALSDMLAKWISTQAATGIKNAISEIGGLFSGSPEPSFGATGTAGGGLPGANVYEAEGGIISGRLLGAYPLRGYEAGGIASSPTLGVFGEAGAEAFVPLRSGKIPVQLRGSEEGKGMTVINYNNIIDETSFVRKYSAVVRNISQASFVEMQRFNKVAGRLHPLGG